MTAEMEVVMLLYMFVGLITAVLSAIRFDDGRGKRDRRLPDLVLLFSWAWPLLLIGGLVWGAVHLARVALGKES